MTTSPPPLPASLREKYLTQVATRRTELAKFLAQCEQRPAAREECEAIHIHAHSLKGTGKTYGYPKISETAAVLEDAVENNVDQKILADLMQNVIRSCDDALQANKDPTPEKSRALTAGAARINNVPAAKPAVFIVDDDPAILEMLQQLLGQDATVSTAADAAQALAAIEREHFDLIVLDDRMPGMTGMQLLEKMEASGKPLPAQVLMLTASAGTPDIIRGMSAGAVDYITKPFDPDKLASRIRSLLRCLRMTVLVADDDAAVRGLLKHKFRMRGFRMLQAENGEQALALAREARPQLAIIDRMMPGLDGLTVLQTMRKEEILRGIPVILLTAKRQNRDVIEGFDLGATDYIVKPFMPDEVLARAMRLLGFHETGRP